MKSLTHKDFHCNINVMARKNRGKEGEKKANSQIIPVWENGQGNDDKSIQWTIMWPLITPFLKKIFPGG